METKLEQSSSYTINTTKKADVPDDTHVSEQAHTKKADGALFDAEINA